jgi:hypothetical protein
MKTLLLFAGNHAVQGVAGIMLATFITESIFCSSVEGSIRKGILQAALITIGVSAVAALVFWSIDRIGE